MSFQRRLLPLTSVILTKEVILGMEDPYHMARGC